MADEILPEYLNVDQPIMYDNSIESSEVIEIPLSTANATIQNLNGTNALIFRYSQQSSFYRLGSDRSGIKCTFRFLTRQGGADARNADISLASNFFGHFFDQAILKIGGEEIEHIYNLGVVMDTIYSTMGSEFRYKNGEEVGYIQDENSGLANDRLVNTGALAGDAAVPANHVTNNTEFNNGYLKRKRLFNYVVAADGDMRTITIFIPLFYIFTYCQENDRLLKCISFEFNSIAEAKLIIICV